jgi:hypothetical protein
VAEDRGGGIGLHGLPVEGEQPPGAVGSHHGQNPPHMRSFSRVLPRGIVLFPRMCPP